MNEKARLPPGWRHLETNEAASLERELAFEMSARHPLSGCSLAAVARCDGNDDVLYQWRDAQEQFVVVHLTWIGRREQSPDFPGIEFEGTFAEFAAAYA